MNSDVTQPNATRHLVVRHVNTTTVEVQSSVQGDIVYVAALGVWADLSPLRQAGAALGCEDGFLPVLRIVDAAYASVTPNGPTNDDGSPANQSHDTARLTLTLTQQPPAEVTVDDNGVVTSINAVEPDPDQQVQITLPTTAVALTLALASTPLAYRIVLIDADAPDNAAFLTIPVEALSAAVEVDPDVLHPLLHAVVIDPLSKPLLPEDDDEAVDAVLEGLRRDLWPAVSGLGLGQIAAYKRLVNLGEAADTLSDDPDSADAQRRLAICEIADLSLAYSKHYLDEHSTVNEPDFANYPGRLGNLNSTLATLDSDAYEALVEGTPFTAVAAAVGFQRALPAFAALLAARATVLTTDPDQEGYSTSWIIGTWMSGPDEPLTWTFPASSSLLAYYDMDVLNDLLSVADATDDDDLLGNDLLGNYLHTLVSAVQNADLDVDDLRVNLAAADIKPVNFPDIQALAEGLLSEFEAAAERDDSRCDSCAAVDQFLRLSGWDTPRIARAATGLLPILADLNADASGHEVGDAEWVEHRNVYLAHWLGTAA